MCPPALLLSRPGLRLPRGARWGMGLGKKFRHEKANHRKKGERGTNGSRARTAPAPRCSHPAPLPPRSARAGRPSAHAHCPLVAEGCDPRPQAAAGCSGPADRTCALPQRPGGKRVSFTTTSGSSVTGDQAEKNLFRLQIHSVVFKYRKVKKKKTKNVS